MNNPKGLVDLVIGLQWGDEGKGAVVDRLCATGNYVIVVRSGGGPNAGHTVTLPDGRDFKLHQIPSGIISGKLGVLGSGMVIDPVALFDEAQELEKRGIDVFRRLMISNRASWLLPWHCLEDGKQEQARGANKIGTTGRGIGPCYTDHVSRSGLRMCDFAGADYYSRMIAKLEERCLNWKDVFSLKYIKRLKEARERLAPLIKLVEAKIRSAIKEYGERILIEGAQGTMLDARHGTYPFVTSTGTTAAACVADAGIPLTAVREVIGVTKAYTTRVGEGSFPSEITNELGERLRQVGREYGATTNRPRRCGWLDMVQLKYAAALNGVTKIVVTKLDVLSGLPEIHYVSAYFLPGVGRIGYVPADLTGVEAFYRSKPGWPKDIRNCPGRQSLPQEAKGYLETIEELAPIDHISIGPQRNQFIR